MAKGIYERKGQKGDVTYYIRYQVDGTDIKERVGRRSRGFTREMAKDALKQGLGRLPRVGSIWRRRASRCLFRSWRNVTESLPADISEAGKLRNTSWMSLQRSLARRR
jgi:hypothetical protein